MQAEDFITFAGKIAAQGTVGTAGYRSAISRAYYGAYHLLLEYLEGLGHHCNSDNIHVCVKRCLANCDVPEGANLGQRIGNLHENRKDADYDLQNPASETQGLARACVLRAEEIRRLLAECRVEPLRSKIAAGVDHYRRTVLRDLA